MKKQLLCSAITLALAAPAQAAVLIGSYGASTTLGQVASPTTINSVRYNPAAGYIALDINNNESMRFGYWSQIGGSVEFGKADNFEDDIDRLISDLDDFNDKLDATINATMGTNPSSIFTSETEAFNTAKGIETDFNSLLETFGEDGRIKASFSSSIPGLPVVFQVPKLPGVISLDAGVGFVSSATFKDAPFSGLPADASGITDYNQLNDFKTDSQVVVKGGTLFQVGLGYSQPISSIREIGPLQGELILGAKANLYIASLASVKTKVDRDDDKDVGDLISDGLEESEDSTAIGIDVGAVWAAENYQLGLTLKNLNSPELESSLSDDLNTTSGTQTISLDPQTTVDGAAFLKDRMFMLAGSMDLNKVDDLVGDEVQMMHVSGSFFPASTLIPTIRLGYEKNLVGEELSAINAGIGLFRGVMNLDATYGLETTEVDGDSIPRRLGIQLSFEETF